MTSLTSKLTPGEMYRRPTFGPERTTTQGRHLEERRPSLYLTFALADFPGRRLPSLNSDKLSLDSSLTRTQGRLQFGNALAERGRGAFNLCEGKSRRDVLGAVPIEGFDRDENAALDVRG